MELKSEVWGILKFGCDQWREKGGCTKPRAQPELLGGAFSELVTRISNVRAGFVCAREKKGSFSNMFSFPYCGAETYFENNI